MLCNGFLLIIKRVEQEPLEVDVSHRLKKKVELLFGTLAEGIEHLRVSEIEVMMEILQSMQEAVISVGEFVEHSVTDHDHVIASLTDLAERIYELSLDENYRKIQKLNEVAKYSESVKQEVYEVLPSAYEILFVPYKVAMWDALESIYLAAAGDKDCEIHVMPVPYYHVKEDRTALEMEYEGNLFPEDIPIVDYRKYRIEDMQPDAIFIHNPYDDKNFVTSLPERYFSSELKKYTDHLVYVPYYVSGYTEKDFFCLMPGVHNAWRIFVQSERIREVYIRYHSPEKIVASGLPQIDKVINNEQKKPEVPDEWKQALSGRKVFLLNTHLDNIINNAEDMVRGMEQLIELFEERKNAAVIWRPHPLSLETAKAMNPSILKRYSHLVERFKMLHNGAYDETSDPHLAIALADAYVGDWSSLVVMFGVTGKPIFIREIVMFGKQERDASQMMLQQREKEISEGRRFETVYYEDSVCLEDYVTMILQGRDTLMESRKKEFANLVSNTQGTVGKQIWQYVKRKISKED